MTRRRDPKPEGMANVPRHIKKDVSAEPKKEELAGLLEKCRSLTSQDLIQEDSLDYMMETSIKGSERAKVLLYAANLENALDLAIVRRLISGRTKELFKMAGPLGTFSNKILVAYALDVFGKQTKRNFDIIRTIRNTFAHCRKPITFKTSAVKELGLVIESPIALVRPFKQSKGFPLPIKKEAADKYVETCVITAANLQHHASQLEPEALP